MTFFDILKSIDIPDQMGCYEESDSMTSNTENYIEKVLGCARIEGIKINYFNGASQLCFVEEGANRVYKLPFDGLMEEYSDYDEETEEYNDKESWRYFETNYTAKTEEIYNEAVRAGISEFFAEIHIEGKSFNNCPIWSQTFVTPLRDDDSSVKASEGSRTKAKAMIRNHSYSYIPFDVNWIAVCLDLYGEEKFNRLLQFIDDLGLDDFHYGNYGYDRDGRPVILDYCGYNE